MKTALLAGATGLIGNHLLKALLEDEQYNNVIVLTRKPVAESHPKQKNIVVNFDQLTSYHNDLHADDIFCCLGTTMKKAGSKEAFRKVDFHYPVELAKITNANGGRQYLLVSSLGADKNSGIFYNQVKGETEASIKQINFKALHIFRPSLLLGDREEQRSGEDAAKIVYRVFRFLIPKKYKAIDASRVANAMLQHAKKEVSGIHIHESAELQNF
jgi:uncharacterized protein YbjT (DUF2867 family)